MPVIVSTEGKAQMFKTICGADVPETFVLKLFTNDYTPDATSTAASFTEATGGGYAPVSVPLAAWSVAVAPDLTVSMTMAQQIITLTGPEAGYLYGWYLVGATSGKLYAAERFGTAPWPPAAAGDEVRVTTSFKG